jgi:dihydrofolate reductase
MIVSIVVAAAENGVIGKGNRLPWHLPADLKFFKQLTTGHTIIMGRNTHLSIGKPLPKRRNIVLSTTGAKFEGCETFTSLEAALAACAGETEVFIIGGGKVYQQAFEAHLVHRIYMTKVHHHLDGDTHFQFPNPQEWDILSMERFEEDDDHAWPFSFIQLQRKP